ncbi:cytochrome P450 family protein [Pleurotus pulmonarius]
MKGVSYAIAAATTIWVAAIVVIRRKRSVVNRLRGPPSPSWLLGNEQDILRQSEVGNIESRWIREYGTTFKISSCYGRAGIFTVDPRAIQHIFQTAGYRYSRRADSTQMNRNMFGRSILSASSSEVHQRHRKVMNPVFTAQQLRGFLPVFQTVASRMTQKLKDQIQNGEKSFNIISWLGRCTLDAIGTAAFNYPFGALEDSHEDELSQSLENLFADTLPFPPKWDLLFKSAWRYIPTSILQLVEYMPTKEYRRFRRFRKLCRGVAKALIRENTGATHSDVDRDFGENSAGSRRDFMSVMARANDSEDPRRQLDEEEVLSQMGTLILVGHDTTANTLSWLLYELSKHLDDQERVRDEIQARRAQLPSGAPFTISDLESLTFTNATIKEALRLHPIVFELRRTAERDDTIPLDIPIVTTDGEVIKELPIRKGQDLFISISGYNRLPSIWGDDADAWNPRRFIDVPRKENEKRTAVGVYANLMSFSGGVRACIGWRFALIELQALVVEMIENFTVSLPDGVEISRLPAGMMIPVVKDKLDEGTQMPLVLSLVE